MPPSVPTRAICRVAVVEFTLTYDDSLRADCRVLLAPLTAPEQYGGSAMTRVHRR